MAYRLRIRDNVQKEVRRTARKEAERALADLGSEGMSFAERVHEARKRLKKIRGLARLVRPALGKQYSSENEFFRDAGRKLASARDAQVLIETVETLADQAERDEERAALNRAACELNLRREGIEARAGETIASVNDDLEQAAGRVRAWGLQPNSLPALSKGLRKTYKRGRKATAKAYSSGSAEDFHDWRKRVKYHRYHIRLLRKVWPQPMKVREQELKTLSDLLGNDHDLVVLDEFLRASGIDGLSDLIARASSELRSKARPLGDRIFAEKPKRFADRIESYWLTAARS